MALRMRETATLKRIVKARALELQKEGCGYLKAIRTIATEVYDSGQGVDTRTGEMAASMGRNLSSIVMTLLGLAIWVFKKVFNTEEARKAERKQAIDRISETITPWVDEAWRS